MTTLEKIRGSRLTRKIREINQKYSQPKITMSPGVKFALLMLRLYLILLVVLLGYKFWTIIHGA